MGYWSPPVALWSGPGRVSRYPLLWISSSRRDNLALLNTRFAWESATWCLLNMFFAASEIFVVIKRRDSILASHCWIEEVSLMRFLIVVLLLEMCKRCHLLGLVIMLSLSLPSRRNSDARTDRLGFCLVWLMWYWRSYLLTGSYCLQTSLYSWFARLAEVGMAQNIRLMKVYISRLVLVNNVSSG